MKRFTALCLALIMCVIFPSLGLAGYDASEYQEKPYTDYLTNCYAFVSAVIAKEQNVTLPAYDETMRYYPNYDNYLVGDKLLNSNGYTATTFENIKALFDKAEVGDVVQMYWDTGVTYSSQHTVIVSATDKANNKVWFLHSNWWPDFKTPQITNTGFSYSTIAGCCTNAIDKPFHDGTYKYGGISLYRFSGSVTPLPEGSVRIDEEHFPDEIFRNYVLENCDPNKDGILSAEEAASVTRIDVDLYIDVDSQGITDLKGIEYFTALGELRCYNNELTELDVSNNTALTSLSCGSNQLTELDVSNNTALTYLNCGGSWLTELDVSNNTALTYLDCGGNSLPELDVSNNTALTYLGCALNGLTALDVSNNIGLIQLDCDLNNLTVLDLSKNTALTELHCWSNQLTALDVSGCTALTKLYCERNRLTTLDLSKNTALTYLDCSYNQLTALDVSSNTALTELYCYVNQLTKLDVSKNTALTELDCRNNQLTALDVSKNTALTRLYCERNRLTTLDLSKNTALTCLDCSYNQLTALDVSNNTALTYLECSDNQLTALDLSKNTALRQLLCWGNQLTELDVSNCPNLSDSSIACEDGVRILRNKPRLVSSLINVATNTPVSLYIPHSSVISSIAQLIEAVVKSGIITDTGTKETLQKVAKCLQIISSIDSMDSLKRFFTDILIPSIFKSPVDKGDNGYGEKFQLSESLSLNVTPGEFKTSEGTVKITLASSRDLSNDVYCMIASGDSGMFFKVPASGGSRRVFTAEFNAGELFASMDAGMIDIMCVSCVSDDEGICGMMMSNTAVVDWLKKDNTPDDTPPDNTPPKILTEYLADAITGTAYSVQLQASGTTPITWTKSGTFSRGLTFSTSGLISGTPTKAGSFNITFTAKNAYGKVSKKLKLTVIEPVKITTASLKAGTIGKTYSVTLKAKGTKPITWSAEGLPSGMSINAKTGKISGKPTEYGQFSVNVTASNGAGSVTRTLPLTVKAIAPTLSGSLKKPTLNMPYSSGLKLSKGSTPITWSISGTLPTGLTFDPETGQISGTPTSYAKSGYKITITAKNDAGSKSKRITLKVNGKAPVIKATLPKTATYGQPYNATLKATGSDPITFTVDRLPDGLSLNDGVISGTVTETTKTFKFTVYAENPVKKVKKSFTIKINSIPKSAKETPPENTDNESGNETPSDNNTVDQTVTDNTENQTQTGNPQTESQKSGVPEGYVIVAELGTVSCDEAGMYDFEVTLSDDVPAGAELMYVANSDVPSDDDEIAEFFDSTGNEITAVPKDRKISVSIWLNPHTVYHPAIAVKH